MANITLRDGLGRSLTWNEVDDNFENINNETILNTSKISSLEEVTHSNGFDLQDPDSLGDLTYNDTTKTFTLAPKSGQADFHYWVDGTKYVCTSAVTSAALPSTESNATYYGYLDENKVFNIVLHEDVTLPIFYKYAIVSLAYYNQSLDIAVPFEERHGYRMSSATHEKEHSTIGAVYSPPGLAISGLVNGVDTFTGITSGKIYDEDIPHIIDAHTTLPFLYRDGAGNGEWVWTAPDNKVTYMDSGSVSVWNKDTGTEWTLEPADSQHDFIIHFIVVYKTLSGFSDAAIIIDQAGYSSRANARAAVDDAKDKLILDGLPSPEMVFIGAYIGKKDGELQDLADGKLYVDLRGSSSLGSASDSAPSSNAADLIVDASGFIKHLDTTDTDQQKVDDKLDTHAHDDEYISLTNAVLGSDLDTNGHKIYDTNGPLLLGSGAHYSARSKGLYYDEPAIVQNTSDRTYNIVNDAKCVATVDVTSTTRWRGHVDTQAIDLNGHSAATTSNAYHFGSNYMFGDIYNSGTGGGDVGSFAGLMVESAPHDDVSIADLCGIHISVWHDSTNDIENYVAINIDPPSVTGDKFVLKCNDADAAISIAGEIIANDLSIGEIQFPNVDGTMNQVIVTDGSGNLSWADNGSGGGGDLVDDLTPQLGGDLDTNGKSLYDTTGPLLLGSSSASSRIVGLSYSELNIPINVGDRTYVVREDTSTIASQDMTTTERYRAQSSYHLLDLAGYNYAGNGTWASAFGDIHFLGVGNSGSTQSTVAGATVDAGMLEISGDTVVTDAVGYYAGADIYSPASIDTYTAFLADTAASGATTRFAFKCNDADATIDIAGKLKTGAITLPNTDGTANQVLKTDGSGNLSWADNGSGGGMSELADDSSPQLGGDLDTNGHHITSPGNLIISADGSSTINFTNTVNMYGELNANNIVISNSVAPNLTLTPDTANSGKIVCGSHIDLNWHELQSAGNVSLRPGSGYEIHLFGTTNIWGALNAAGIEVNNEDWPDLTLKSDIANGGRIFIENYKFPAASSSTAGQIMVVDISNELSFQDNSVDNLSNTDITSVANDDVLVYNSTTSKWENSAVIGDISSALSTINGE